MYPILDELRVAFPCVNPEGLASPIFLGTFWSHGQIIVAGISQFKQVVRHSGFYKINTCALLRKRHVMYSSQTYHLCGLHLRQHPFFHYGKFTPVTIGTNTGLKTESFAVLGSSRFVTTEW